VVQKRFNFPDGGVELYAEKVMNRGLCAVAQAESLRYKLLGGLAVRRLFSNPHALELILLRIIVPCHLHNRHGYFLAKPVFDGDINQSPPSVAFCKQWDLYCSIAYCFGGDNLVSVYVSCAAVSSTIMSSIKQIGYLMPTLCRKMTKLPVPTRLHLLEALSVGF
jgi:hypothetical protein